MIQTVSLHASTHCLHVSCDSGWSTHSELYDVQPHWRWSQVLKMGSFTQRRTGTQTLRLIRRVDTCTARYCHAVCTVLLQCCWQPQVWHEEYLHHLASVSKLYRVSEYALLQTCGFWLLLLLLLVWVCLSFTHVRAVCADCGRKESMGTKWKAGIWAGHHHAIFGLGACYW